MRSRQVAVVIATLLLSSACEKQQAPQGGNTVDHVQAPIPQSSIAQLCSDPTKLSSIDTQALLDLAYEINPTSSPNYNGPYQKCYAAIMEALSHRK